MYEVGKIFDISSKRPKVLLVGNGPIAAEGNAINWKDAIYKLSENDSEKIFEGQEQIPYSIQATISLHCEDKERRNKYVEVFGGDNYKYYQSKRLQSLLELPWDAVLTTNYTYDLEYNLCPHFVDLKNKSQSKYVYNTNNKGHKGYGYILLRNFNRMSMGDSYRDIWHIHGEIRNKSSIVLTHDEYARQVRAVLMYNSERGNEYSVYNSEVKFKSWIDYLVLGDVYIVGFGMDFSEFDLWWILNRRLRENTGKGKLLYLNPKENKNAIYLAIEKLGGKFENLDIEIDKSDQNNEEKYLKFYEKLIDYLRQNI